MKESVVIISADPGLGERIFSDIAPEGILSLNTKYYSASVPVTMMSCNASSLDRNVKGVVVVEDALKTSLSVLHSLTDEDDDVVKVYFAKDETHLATCIDHGFELVPGLGDPSDLSNVESGTGRIIEALKCRVWQTDEEPSTCSDSREENPEELLNSFESLISQMQQVRNMSSTLSDDERRARAECVASQLAKLLCDDDDSDEDLTVT